MERTLANSSKIKLNIFGEIVSGIGFGRKNLYVEYTLDLQNEWRCTVDHPLQGVSQLSSPSQPYPSIHHFCFPIEVELEAEPQVKSWPKLLFEVSSYDSMDRRIIEGYGYLPIPQFSDSIEATVQTWRARGSIRQQMKTFFIGGAPELADKTYIGIPSSCKGKPVNKYGFVTENSGALQVRLNVILTGDERDVKARVKPPIESRFKDPFSTIQARLQSLKLAQTEREEINAMQ